VLRRLQPYHCTHSNTPLTAFGRALHSLSHRLNWSRSTATHGTPRPTVAAHPSIPASPLFSGVITQSCGTLTRRWVSRSPKNVPAGTRRASAGCLPLNTQSRPAAHIQGWATMPPSSTPGQTTTSSSNTRESGSSIPTRAPRRHLWKSGRWKTTVCSMSLPKPKLLSQPVLSTRLRC
jgi:hypothetical protein